MGIGIIPHMSRLIRHLSQKGSGWRLGRKLLCDLFALGQRLTKNVRVRCLEGGLDVVWVTACTASGRELRPVMLIVGHPTAISATPFALAIGNKRVDGVAAMSYILRDRKPLRVHVLSLLNNATNNLIGGQYEVSLKYVNDALLRLAILNDIGESTNHDEW
jgi:hypothetical protein